MDPISRFQLACSKHSINLSTSSTESSQFSIAPTKPLDNFQFFKLLPYEIRRKIWKLAINSIQPRTVYIHPNPSNNPALAHACYESRMEIILSDLFWICTSNHVLSRIKFSAMINNNIDLLYLDQRVRHSQNPDGNPIPTALLIFRNWLRPVKQLAINLRDTRAFLPIIWGRSSWYNKGPDLWHILGASCPDLEFLWIVDNGPFEEGYNGELVHDNNYQENRSYVWNMMWADMHQSLMIAKFEGVLSKRIFMRPMDMKKVNPLKLPFYA